MTCLSSADVCIGITLVARAAIRVKSDRLQVVELLHQLREFVSTFVSAFTSKHDQDRAEAVFTATLNAFTDPALQMCKSNAATLSSQRYGQPVSGSWTKMSWVNSHMLLFCEI